MVLRGLTCFQYLFTLGAISTAAKRTPVTQIPQCLTGQTAPDPHDAAALAAAQGKVTAAHTDFMDSSPPLPQTPWVDIAFYDTRPRPDVASMRRASALCNVSSYVRFHALLKYPITIPGFRVTLLKLPTRAQCLYDGMRRISHGPGPQYLYKPLLHWVMPREVEKLILLDTDVVMVRDVRELHAEFSRFGTAVLGVGNEQSNLYGKGGEGKNGGVQLLDLAAMRREPFYDAVLDRVASGTDGRRIGYLGDQTLYSYIAMDYPFLMHRLPCEWNRQISMHFGFHNATVHSCPRRCGILHANFGPFKCVARLLQQSPTCATWTAFQRQLTLSEAARAAIPRESIGGGGGVCPKAPAGVRTSFRRAITRFFSDCCVPDEAAAKGWPPYRRPQPNPTGRISFSVAPASV